MKRVPKKLIWSAFWLLSLAALWGESVVLTGSSLIPHIDFFGKRKTANVVESNESDGIENDNSRFIYDRPQNFNKSPEAVGVEADVNAHAVTQAMIGRLGREKEVAVAELEDTQKQLVALSAKLTRAEREAEQATDAARRSTGQQSALQAELDSAQANADRADREKAVAIAAQKVSEGVEADHGANLAETRKRLMSLTEELTRAKHEAAQAAETIRLTTNERAALRAAVITAQAKTSEADNARNAVVAQLTETRERFGATKTDLSNAKRDAAIEAESSKRLTSALASARAQADQAARDKVASLAKLEETQTLVATTATALTEAKRAAEQATGAARRSTENRAQLQAALVSAQANADQAGREKAVALGKLEEMQARMIATATALTDAKRQAAEAVDATRRIAGGQADKSAQQAALVSAQARADSAEREKAASVAALAASERADGDHRAQLEEARNRVVVVGGKLKTAEREAAQATETAKRLAREQVGVPSLQAALVSAQTIADQAGREKAAALAKVEEVQARMAATARALETAKRETAQATATTKRLAREQVDSSARQAALALAREKADRADRETRAALVSRDVSERAGAKNKANLDEAQKRIAAQTTALAESKRDAVPTTNGVRHATDEGVVVAKDVAHPSTNKSSGNSALQLSEGGIAHVVLRYPFSVDVAHARAIAVKSKLDGLASDFADVSEAFKKRSSTKVAYYYKQDESVANSIAGRLAAPNPMQIHISTDRPPRPGTIEVSLGN